MAAIEARAETGRRDLWVVADVTKTAATGTSMEQALHFKRLGLNLHDTMIYQKNSYHFPPNANR